MLNETILKFNYPESLLYEYFNWVVLLRPKQVTAGSMILACKEEAERMPDVSAHAFEELPRVTADLEQALSKTFIFDKINYILLMMVDKHVHFHVIPRYSSKREACGVTFIDAGWPKHPDMTKVIDMTDKQFHELRELLKLNWPTTPQRRGIG